MSRRIDWYDDPAAPPANSMKPSAGAYVTDAEGRVLLIQRSDNGNWSLPGGAMDPGESLRACAERETLEETGIVVEVTGVVGIFTDPLHRIEYTSNGEVRQEFSVIYRADYVSGVPTPSSESTRVSWVEPGDIPTLQLHRSQRLRLDWALAHPGQVYVDQR